MSSSIPSWQILTAHAQPFRGARDLAFCLKVPLDSLLVWASSRGSGETVRMRRLAWTFAASIGDKNQIRLMRPICYYFAVYYCNKSEKFGHQKIVEVTLKFELCVFITQKYSQYGKQCRPWSEWFYWSWTLIRLLLHKQSGLDLYCLPRPVCLKTIGQ